MKTKHKFNDAWEYESYCDDLMNDFMDTLTPPFTREATEDEIEDFGDCTVSFMFTVKGMNLMERYIDRLQVLGEKLFPGDNIDVQCSGIIQP